MPSNHWLTDVTVLSCKACFY